MRGINDSQNMMFSYFSAEQRVPAHHPLRAIKDDADKVLAVLSPTFDAMYSRMGRPSIPPERLLKAQLLIALYSVRSETLFCERLDYNILFRWFLDMNLEEPSMDATTFTKNRDRLLEHEVALKFFEQVVRLARKAGLLSDEHFTVDGSLIEAWASLKSFRPKGEDSSDRPTTDDDPGNPTVNFRGEKRSNATPRLDHRPGGTIDAKRPWQRVQAQLQRPRVDGEPKRSADRPARQRGYRDGGAGGGRGDASPPEAKAG